VTFDFREAWQQTQAFGLAIAVHALAALFVIFGTIDWSPFDQEPPVGILIEAVMVDTSQLEEQREEARQAVERQEMLDERARELEQQREREQQRQRDLEEQRRQQQIEEQREREAEDRLAQIRKEREAKLEAERLKQQRELEQIREEREAAERQKRIEEERLKQLEARRQAEREEQLVAEAEAQRQALEQREFQAGRLATEREKYWLTIQQVVTQNWLRPPTAQAGLRCEVKVVQIPGGDVISANVGSPCNADAVTRRSIIAAVERVGTLPYRGFEDVFEREITFEFKYDGE